MGVGIQQRKTRTCNVIMSAGMQEVIMQNWISLLQSCTLQLKVGFNVPDNNILHFFQCQMRLLVTLKCLYNILSSLFNSLSLVSPGNQ